MMHRFMCGLALGFALLGVPTQTSAHGLSLQSSPAGKAAELTEAKGTFEVKVAPLASGPGEGLAGYSLDKTYHGDLEATGKGQMLSGGDPASGNAGYVAIERVTGKLGGKSGSFALMQSGTMSKGSAPQLTVTIVPGSGTGELSGIYGSMTITISAGRHDFTLQYAFAQ